MAGNLRALVAELIGTFALVFLAAGAVCADAVSGGRLGPAGTALAEGLAVAFVYGTLGRLAPGLFNPALAAALALVRRLDPVRAALSLLCQLLGAALAGLLLAQVFAHAQIASVPPHLGAPMPSAWLGFRGATLLEAVLCFFFAAAACRSWADATPSEGAARAALLGAFAAAAGLAAGPVAGAVLNPARAFGPAIASGYWTHQYVHWFGPLAGACLGVGLSHWLLERPS